MLVSFRIRFFCHSDCLFDGTCSTSAIRLNEDACRMVVICIDYVIKRINQLMIIDG